MECSSSVKHTPKKNGVAEKMIRTNTEKIKCLLNHFELPEEMWAFYSHTAVFYENKAGRLPQGTTPTLRTDVSTEQYFDMDSVTLKRIILAMLSK